MKANVRINGATHTLNVTNIDKSQPDCRYGEVVYQGVRYAVAESRSIKHADGKVEKQWDVMQPMTKARETPYSDDDSEWE